MLLLVSAWSAWSVPEVARRWFTWPNVAYLAPVPLITGAVLLSIWRRIWDGSEVGTFVRALVVFLLGFHGFIVSLWPYVVPLHLTIWGGASDPQTLAFIGIGVAILIPFVLAYHVHAYWVFPGKT